MFVFNGESSDSHNVVVQYYPGIGQGARNQTKTHVPGRNGDIVVNDGSYLNYTQEYDVYIRGGHRSLPTFAEDVGRWLLGADGYCRLEDSYNPDIFRLAQFAGPVDIENMLNRFGRAMLSFDCKPQKFYKDGESQVTMAKPGTIYNRGFPALPIITVYGSGSGTVTAGGVTVQLKSIDGYVVLDCDVQDAYKGAENKNGTISAPEFPVLQPGENLITWTGGVTSVEIIPRWWTI